jgi:ergothioneine biosynthesis protein EgtB
MTAVAPAPSASPQDWARLLRRDGLARGMREARARTRSLIDGLSDAQWRVPCQAGVNPIAWEAAHVAWFTEFWTLRGPHQARADGFVHAARPARHAGPDEILDSARLVHASRWQAPLPDRARLHAMLDAQLEATLAALAATRETDEALYPFRLSLFHEDMHCEAFVWLRQALGYPAPAALPGPKPSRSGVVRIDAGEALIGWPARSPGFAFDNEQPALRRALPAFEIDVSPVSNAQFQAFIDAGGYDRASLWPAEAGRWRAQRADAHPAHWRRGPDGWQSRRFDRWVALIPEEPVMHVNAFEAEAYCRWVGRTLPGAAQWERAASAGALDWGGSVWEWTADAFEPYPGFRPGPYKDYSAPWFGTHREARGGAFVAHERMHHPRYRNFFLPHRCDLFTGFRTARTL